MRAFRVLAVKKALVVVKKFPFAFLTALVLLVSGCIYAAQPPAVLKSPSAECVRACQNALTAGTDLSAGPCLGNPMANFTDWVCDVAHSPRESIDNLPENQCAAYRNGTARHFVEVSPDCEIIATV